MGHARIRGSRGWVTARGHPAIVGWYENATLLGRWRDVPETRAHLPVSDADPSAGWKYCITSTTAYFVPPEQRTMPF